MERYQVAEYENGPWLELVVTNNPLHALQKARAAFPDWDVVHVAKMRPIMGQDLLPDPEMLLGEIAERLIAKHGSSVVSQLTDEIDIYDLHEAMSIAATGSLLDAESETMVPAIIRRYKPDEQASLSHFQTNQQDKPRLEDLL